MKKILKIFLRVVIALLGLAVVIVVAAALYFNSNIINSEKISKHKGPDIKELTATDYSFRDLNRNNELDIYEDARLSLDERANDLLLQMTLEEKITLLKGSGMKSGMGLGPSDEGVCGAVGTIVPIPRLGIPAIILSDGPAGLRINPTRKNEDKTYYCTAFPIGTLMAFTWNTELVEKVGQAMGNEVLEYGVDVILGPGVNIHRSPLCGSNFEYYSEDPVLTGEIGAAMMHPYTAPEMSLSAEQVGQVVATADLAGCLKQPHGKKSLMRFYWPGRVGQEGGNSVSGILSGKVNPSGRLPMTFPVALEDHGSSANFPMDGIPMSLLSMLSNKNDKPEEEQIPNVDYTKYEESIYVGYRHFDKNNLEVSYPFGFGLSYTNFWTLEEGPYIIHLASSSRDLRLSEEINF